MATHSPSERFALRPVFERPPPDGAWWPESRRLSDQLARLFALWPPNAGRIALLDVSRRSIDIIPPDTPPQDAKGILDGVTALEDHRHTAPEQQPGWDNEGGHL